MSRSGRSCAPAPTPSRSTTPSTLKGERRLKNGWFSSLTSYADPRRPTMKIHDVRLHIVRPEEIGLGGRKAPKRLSSKSGLFTGVRRRSPTASLSSFLSYPCVGARKGALWSLRKGPPDRRSPDGRGLWASYIDA